ARESGGNPFFVSQLVQSIQGNVGPTSGADLAEEITLDQVLWGRISRLPEPARRLLEGVSVSGRPLEMEVACRAAGLGTDGHAALSILGSHRLIRSTGPVRWGEIEAYHDRIRETVLVHLPTDTLKAHHGRLAAEFEASGRADHEVIAIHHQGAGNPSEAG